MRQYVKNTIQGFFVLALVLLCVMQMELKAEAEQVNDTVNGVFYESEKNISVGYVSTYYYGAGGYTVVDVDIDGDRVSNVKSNNKNLVAKKTSERYRTTTEKDWETDQITTKTRYSEATISFFAKKAGTYTVTFDVIKADGTVRCTKTITVKATGSSGNTYVSPCKSVKYAGKEIGTYYPFSTKKSGKLKVSMRKGYKLVSIEVGKYNSEGKFEYKKVRNNKTIKLATKEVYKTGYTWSDGGITYTYDDLFPYTEIKITYKKTKTGEQGTLYYGMYTMNKKQSW